VRRVISAAAVAAAVVLTTTGCGGGGGSTLGDGASITPASALAFVAFHGDASPATWQAVRSLVQRLPSDGGLLAALRNANLKGELELVLLPDGGVVALTRARTIAPPLHTRTVRGWTAVARDAAALETFAAATTTLAADPDYRHAAATLPANALVQAYANGAVAAQLLGSLPGEVQVQPVPYGIRTIRPRGARGRTTQQLQFAWGRADVVAVSGGTALEIRARAAPPLESVFSTPFQQAPTPPYVAALPDEIPAGALFVADVQVAPGSFESVDPSTFPPALARLLAANRDLPNQLDTILGGETAVYVRSSEVTLVTQPQDTVRAVNEISALKPLLHARRLVHALIGGELVVSTSRRGIDDFRSGGAKLSSDAGFAHALRDAGAPAATTGFVYADVAHAPAVVRTLAPLFGVSLPPGARTLAAFGKRTGGLSGFTVFFR
jgi:hypothetical protein